MVDHPVQALYTASHEGRVGFPGRVDGGVPEADETVPGLGEHTESVLSEAGFDPD